MTKSNYLKKLKELKGEHWAIGLIVILLIAVASYGQYRLYKLSLKLDELGSHLAVVDTRLASSTTELQETITKTRTTLANTLTEEIQNVNRIEQQLGNYRQEVGAISSTVTTLEKLSKTDPELLQKYSKVFFLNEHYAPPRLVEIPNEYKYVESKNLRLHADAWPFLKKLLDEANQAGIKLYISSAFRSFNEQSALKGQYSITYGVGTANQFSADQGYSEHQLGTTIDFITTGLGGNLEGFEKTAAYNWLKANAHKYGFVLSYPENNKHYVFEPWHWRFVGTRLATYLYHEGLSFYDVDQRKIDEYLVSFFE